MPTVVISVAGVDVTENVLFSTARFSSFVNSKPGEAYMRIRDLDEDYSVDTGADWLVTVDGEAVWRGFVTQVKRVYIAPAMNVAVPGTQRFLDLLGADLNILLTKRIVSDHGDRENVEGVQFPAGTADTTAITELLSGWLDISGDDLDTTSGVDHVGDLDPEQKTRAWSGSWTWGQAMDTIAMLPAAIYYIRPEAGSPKGTFVYCDVDVPNSPFGLSDQPDGSSTRGYREMEISLDGSSLANDVLAWGMGYGSQDPVFVRDQDALSLSEHGRWQTGRVVTGVYKQGTINRIAESIIDGSPSSRRGAKDDKPYVRLVTYEPGLLAGHVVEFTSAVWGYTDTIPVRQMTVTFEAPDNPRYELLLSHEIDAPWSFIDSFWPQFPVPETRGCLEPPCCPPYCPPGNKTQPRSCETGCLAASCRVDDFNRTVAGPDWGEGWATISSSANSDGMVPGLANMANVASWSVTRAPTTQFEVSTHDFILTPFCDAASEPFDYLVAWTADDFFDTYSPYDQIGSPPPGTYNFPGAFYTPVTPRTVGQQYIDFMFFSQQNTGSAFNATKVRVTTYGGQGYWSLAAPGTVSQFRLPQTFDFTPGHTYVVRLRHTIEGVKAKLWDMAEAEPEEWGYEGGAAGDLDDIRPTYFRAAYTRQFPGGLGSGDPAENFTFDAVKIDLGCGTFSPGLNYVENWERVELTDLGTTTPTGFPWSTSGGGVTWSVENGHATAVVTGSSITATLNDADGPWTLPEVTLTLPFKIATAPTTTSDTSWLSTIFQMAATVQMAITAGPPITGTAKSYIQCAGETTFIPPAFWEDGGIYLLTVEKSDGMRRATVAKQGPGGSSYSTDWGVDTSTSSIFGWSPNINSGSQTFTIYPIRFDYPGMPCYYDGSTPVDGTPDAAPQGPTGFGCTRATRQSSTVFTIPGTFVPGSTFVFREGLLQGRGPDYTENSNNAGVTFTSPVGADEKVQICFLGGVMP